MPELPRAEVYINGRLYHWVRLSERLCQHVNFPGWGQMPPVTLLLEPMDGAPLRLRVMVSCTPDVYVDLGDHRVHPIEFVNPYPHLYAYPAIAVRQPPAVQVPGHSVALAASVFEQGSLW